jgi:hypothetical protein
MLNKLCIFQAERAAANGCTTHTLVFRMSTEPFRTHDFKWAFNFDPDAPRDEASVLKCRAIWTSVVGAMHPMFYNIEASSEVLIKRILRTGSTDRDKFIEAQVIKSSYLSFETKRKLIVEWAKFSKGHSVNVKSLETDFAQVIRRRNAIVHGAPRMDKNGRCHLDYFAGSPLTVEITGDWNAQTVGACSRVSDYIQSLIQEMELKINAKG